MYRLVARDSLKEGEVCLCVPRELDGATPTAWVPQPEANAYQQVEFESLDLIEIAPYLLLVAAQEKAQEIIARAEIKAEQICAETQHQGAVQEREEAKQELLPALVAFADAGQALIVFEEQLVSRCTPQIVRLALEIAEKVIGKAIEEDSGIVASVLERAKHEVVEAKQIRIWLHPADFKLLAEIRPDLVKVGDAGGRKIEIAASKEVSRGGCRLETEMGLVDATVPTQIEEIRRQLLDENADDLNVPAPSAQATS